MHGFWSFLQGLPWATAVRESPWMYPFVQLIHFSGLSLWLGSILAGVDIAAISGLG